MTALDTGTGLLATTSGPGPGLPRPPRFDPRRYRRVTLEVLFIAVLYVAYSLTRLRFTSGDADALRNAHRVFGAEGVLGSGLDLPLNHAVVTHALLGIPAAWYYATAHYAYTLLILMWLWRCHPFDYARARTGLVATTIIGLLVFVSFPVAPPRLLHGSDFIDGMAQWSRFGFWGTGASAPRGAEQFTNQYAAMPSLHVGWAIWCAWWTFKLSPRPRTRWLAWSHPVITAFVVVATANHYSLDVLAGTTVWLLGEASVFVGFIAWRRWHKARSHGRDPITIG